VVTRKAANTTAVQAVIGNEPASFDVEAWLKSLKKKGMKPANKQIKMHFRADLIPQLRDLLVQIEALQEDENREETGVDEVDPLTDAILRFNATQAEFEDGGYELFEFRPRNKRIQETTYAEWQAKYSADDDEMRTKLILLRMAATCVSHPGITLEAFEAFEDEYGDSALASLFNAFRDAYESGGEPEAPFLPLPLPAQSTGTSSNG
jgi:hypothetical protein